MEIREKEEWVEIKRQGGVSEDKGVSDTERGSG